MLFISILNQCWLLKNVYYSKYGVRKINYIEDNINKWQNVNIKTYSYIYPKNINSDRCYNSNCNNDQNLIDQRLNAFHTDITTNNKVLILSNQFNVAPINLSVNDQNIISSLNKLTVE